MGLDLKETEAKPVYSKEVTVLVDADSLIYRAAHAAEKILIEFETGAIKQEHALFEDLAPDLLVEGKIILKSMIDGILGSIEWTLNTKGSTIGEVQLHYTPKSRHSKIPNFRYKLVDDYNEEFGEEVKGYKSGRRGMTLPRGLDELFDEALKDPRVKLSIGFEADDYVVYIKSLDVENTIIAAIDKDILYGCDSGTLGHYNFGKREFIYTTEKEAELNIWRQTLTGDASDSIPSIYRMGPKTAEKILPEWSEDMEDIVIETFIEKGYSKEYFILTRRLVGMHQFKGEDKGVELWVQRND